MKKITLLLLLATSFAFSQSYVLKKGKTVAFSEKAYKKMMDAVVHKDNVYFAKLIKNMEIITLPREIPVYMVKSSWSGMNIVRIKGKDVKLYVSAETVKIKK